MYRLNHLAFTILISLLLLNKNQVQAQTAALDSLLTKALGTDELLPMLIDSAIKYSPESRKNIGNVDLATANLQVIKKGIYSAFSLRTSYGYGTNYASVNNQSATIGNDITNAKSAFYNVGVAIQLPLSMLINRKDIIKVSQSQVSMAAAEKDNAIQVIKQDVTKMYQEFKLLHKLVGISSKNKEAAEINNVLAEKNFLNSQLTVEQVAAVLENYNHSIIQFETYLNNFQTTYMQLEIYTGISLSKLIMNVK